MKITIKTASGEIQKTFDARVGQTLLKQIHEAWVTDMPSACDFWICGACICQIQKWEEFLDKTFRSEPGFPLAQEEVMTCISGLKKDADNQDGDIILQTIY